MRKVGHLLGKIFFYENFRTARGGQKSCFPADAIYERLLVNILKLHYNFCSTIFFKGTFTLHVHDKIFFISFKRLTLHYTEMYSEIFRGLIFLYSWKILGGLGIFFTENLSKSKNLKQRSGFF